MYSTVITLLLSKFYHISSVWRSEKFLSNNFLLEAQLKYLWAQCLGQIIGLIAPTTLELWPFIRARWFAVSTDVVMGNLALCSWKFPFLTVIMIWQTYLVVLVHPYAVLCNLCGLMSGQWDESNRVCSSCDWWVYWTVLCGLTRSCLLLWYFSICTNQQHPCWETWSPCHHISSGIYTRITHHRAGTVSWKAIKLITVEAVKREVSLHCQHFAKRF